jgi:hypothetical protein
VALFGFIIFLTFLKTALYAFGTTLNGMYVMFLIVIVSIFPLVFGEIGLDFLI